MHQQQKSKITVSQLTTTTIRTEPATKKIKIPRHLIVATFPGI